MEKLPRLTILLGAGFSAPFDIPTTTDLTEFTRALRTPSKVVNAQKNFVAEELYEALESEYETVNFELALHAIESLLSYSAVDHEAPMKRIRQVLHPFTSPKRVLKWLFDFRLLTKTPCSIYQTHRYGGR